MLFFLHLRFAPLITVPPAGFLVATAALGSYVIVKPAVVFRRIVSHILKGLDGLTLLLCQFAEDWYCSPTLVEQKENVGRMALHQPWPPTFQCHLMPAGSLVGFAHTLAALSLIDPDGLACYAGVTDVAVFMWATLVHILSIFLRFRDLAPGQAARSPCHRCGRGRTD